MGYIVTPNDTAFEQGEIATIQWTEHGVNVGQPVILDTATIKDSITLTHICSEHSYSSIDFTYSVKDCILGYKVTPDKKVFEEDEHATIQWYEHREKVGDPQVLVTSFKSTDGSDSYHASVNHDCSVHHHSYAVFDYTVVRRPVGLIISGSHNTITDVYADYTAIPTGKDAGIFGTCTWRVIPLPDEPSNPNNDVLKEGDFGFPEIKMDQNGVDHNAHIQLKAFLPGRIKLVCTANVGSNGHYKQRTATKTIYVQDGGLGLIAIASLRSSIRYLAAGDKLNLDYKGTGRVSSGIVTISGVLSYSVDGGDAVSKGFSKSGALQAVHSGVIPLTIMPQTMSGRVEVVASSGSSQFVHYVTLSEEAPF